jgi:hypothetical protein
MRTLSDLPWEPHRLIAVGAVCVVLLGALVGGLLRRWPRVYAATIVLIPFLGLAAFVRVCNLDFPLDLAMPTLALVLTGVAWVTGTAVTGRGLARGIGLVFLAPALVLVAVLWSRDSTPPSTAVATRALVARFQLADYTCQRAANDGTIGSPHVEFACGPVGRCTTLECPFYWIGLDDRGRVDDYTSAP